MRHTRSFLFLLVCSFLSSYGCQQKPAPSGEIFIDQAKETGLDFVHFNGMSGAYYFSEIVGAGGAFLDYDNDGDLDVYCVQGRMLGQDKTLDDALLPPADNRPLRDRLYRNDLEVLANGERQLRFTDATVASGIEAAGYGMGVATGDYNNDGWLDLYVTNFGANQLWRNNGDGTFSDVTQESGQDNGIDDPRWSTSAAFVDVDQDGWLDLFVVNYTDFRIANHASCVNEQGAPEYCGPNSYTPETDRLLRNLGNGTFADVSSEAGLLTAPGPGLGVVTADFNNDGWIDIYVANDQARNVLWMNQANGRFREEALLRGSAVDAQGRAQASMGVDAGDIDADGDLDLFMTHLLNEVNTLYLNDGRGQFFDRTAAVGLGTPSIGFTGFGTALLDVDNDGWLDLIAANGEVRTVPELRAAGDVFPLDQPNQLFLNQAGTFVDASQRAPVLAVPHVSRGTAVGDVDNDGDTDVLMLNNSGPAQLLMNQIGQDAQWLGVRLVGRSGRDMLGAQVSLLRHGKPPLLRRVRSDASYLAAHDPRVVFGLGPDETVGRVRVRWPSGSQEQWSELGAGQYHTLVEGQGQ